MFGLNEALMSFIRRQVGLRTDAASSTGSLHAKVAEARNSIVNTLGTSSHTRANNTIMGWLNSQVKSIQRGVFEGFVDDFSYITISPINTGKSIVLTNTVMLRGPYDAINWIYMTCSLYNSTNLRVSVRRVDSGGWFNADFKIRFAWQVIEFY